MSHYCEKARWALERLDIDYHEERHLQGFHYLRTYAVSGGCIGLYVGTTGIAS
ncbi:MAG: hypothetical protein BMS9Abin33_0684 [Gammaproteobacteria bacterium]|nr:MAG: hypothetical protein BMS9Abin33_0684 [Gammaproteobacteria bacterium]